MNDYILYAGDDKDLKLKVYKRSGGLFDLTGAEMLFSLSKNRYAEASIILATPNQIEITDAENGAAVVHLDSGVTFGNAGKWVYEVDVVKNGKSQIVASGTITILESTLRQAHSDSVDAIAAYTARAEEAANLAEDYADSAEDYAADASESAADALGYKDDVVTAAGTASAAADAAALSASAASDSADGAAASASSAADSADAAADALSSITTTAEDIEAAVSSVYDYVDAAEQAATDAASSESNAAAYAESAESSAEAAAASAAEAAGHLPLSGGTMTGVIESSIQDLMYRDVDDEFLRLSGGTSSDPGARLSLAGPSLTGDNGAAAGRFMLISDNGTSSKSLKGSAGTGELTWGNDTVAMTSDLTDYLPLAGGTMTGGIVSGVSSTIVRDVSSSALQFFGGDTSSNGAGLWLYGKGYSINPGHFRVRANDGTNYVDLIGKPDGTLAWDGKPVACIDSIGSGYIRYKSGIQICWGTVSASSSGASVTLPKSYTSSSTYVVLATLSNGSSTGPVCSTKRDSATKFTLTDSTSSAHNWQWMTIGAWS